MPRPLDLAISLLILLLGLGGGLWSARGAIGPGSPPPAAFAAPSATALHDGRRMAVFRWQGDGRVERIGTAGRRPDGGLGLSLYPGRPAAGAGEQAVLLEAGIRTLWDLRSDEMSRRLEQQLHSFLLEGRQTLTAVLASPAFVADYEPAFRRIAAEAIEAAWEAPETRLVAREAFSHYSDGVLAEVVPVALPVLMSNTQQALRESFGANPARFIGRLVGGEIDRGSIALAVERTLEDPAVAAQIESEMRNALSAPQTEALALAFGRALLRELAARDEALELLEQVLGDRRFAEALFALKQQSLEEMRALTETMLGLGVTKGVHPVTAVVIRAFLRLEGPYFVLLMPAPLAAGLAGGEILRPSEPGR